MDKLSYALGIGIGSQLAGMGASELNIDDFAQAIKDVVSGNKLQVDHNEAQTLVNNFFAEQEPSSRQLRPRQARLPSRQARSFSQPMRRTKGSLRCRQACSIRY